MNATVTALADHRARRAYDPELIAVAVSLDELRLVANAIPAIAAQSHAYGDIAEALKKVLAALGLDVEAAYQELLDGNTVEDLVV